MRKFLILLLLFMVACASLAPQPQTDSNSLIKHPVVITHPDGPLIVGDQVSFEVLTPDSGLPACKSVRISLAGTIVAEENIGSYGMGGRSQATFYWAWDTRGLAAGNYDLTFTLLPGLAHWNEKITLLPVSSLPPPEPQARWLELETSCCVIHFISGTDAENDLDSLKVMLDVQAADVEKRMGMKFNGKIPLTFLPRTLGHGGFTSDGIYVSYLHQNYAGSTAQQVAHHEMVHWLDGQIGGMLRPSILQEGLAVYMSDGHFKVEPILPRAAAIFELGWYIPLRRLADSFYLSQHEIGYVEAAALVSYMVTTYGWERYNSFYRSIEPVPAITEAAAIDRALQAHFGLTLEQLEEKYIAYLHKQSVSETTRTDLRLTVAFYDTVRRYEAGMDPSAYFLNAWLPNVPKMRQRNIVADFLRHPVGVMNRQIESLLVAGDAELRSANYTAAEVNIGIANRLLDLQNPFGQ